jgi:hypothetical protein
MADEGFGFFCQECTAAFLTAEALAQHHKAKHFGKMSPRALTRALRGEVCYWCGEPCALDLGGYHRLAPTIEHLIPKSLNGGNVKMNLRLAHRGCNELRGHAEAAAFKRLMTGEAVTKYELWPHLFAKEGR